MSSTKMQLIYNSGFVPDLAICREGSHEGWLMFKHPDGQWVTLADLNKADRIYQAENQVNDHTPPTP